ncbi:hypothetical protein C0992_009964 [Termitomyces sp. T32_za158]|nr:hypothetical protein C0992_009964 [Termitomyces sp. T32_za158]
MLSGNIPYRDCQRDAGVIKAAGNHIKPSGPDGLVLLVSDLEGIIVAAADIPCNDEEPDDNPEEVVKEGGDVVEDAGLPNEDGEGAGGSDGRW